MRGSYYQGGKNWAARKLKNKSEKEKLNLIDLFSYYKAPNSRFTKSGVRLTPSKKQFYYGAEKYLRDHSSSIRLFK